MNNALEKAKEIIRKNFADGKYGLFYNRNTAGDIMHILYEDEVIQIDICYEWGYFEVFGLTSLEFAELEKFYEKLESNE